MRLHQFDGAGVTPASPIRVLVEDSTMCSVAPDLDVPSGVEVTLCSGPATASDPCPLVLDGWCPAGRPDVVVCAIDGPWAPAVRAAWALESVPVVEAPAGTSLDESVRRAVAVALVGSWQTTL